MYILIYFKKIYFYRKLSSILLLKLHGNFISFYLKFQDFILSFHKVIMKYDLFQNMFSAYLRYNPYIYFVHEHLLFARFINIILEEIKKLLLPRISLY